MLSSNWKNATPEQDILWNYASSLIAYTTITPLCYSGAIAASEFTLYDADKLYIALALNAGENGYRNVSQAYVYLYDMANAHKNTFVQNSAYWDVTDSVVKFSGHTIRMVNQWFSKLSVSSGLFMDFIGYRLDV